MIEVIAFVAFGIALAALLSGRKTADRLETEITALREELKRIEESRPIAAPAADAMAEAPDESEVAESTPQPAEPPVVEPWRRAQIKKGDAIFGGPPPSQDAVEKASRGEPVAARAAGTTTIDAVAPRPRESLESRLGARWAVWVGGIALALGGVFMVKYSIDAGLLSPAVRLFMAAVFGLVLICVGEFVRRRATPLVADEFQNAMIPGILTAAGAVTLFGVCYAAHGIYGFIGPAAAFTLLALVSLATVGLSLLHGQALAGLGLLASLLTPALVSSESPSPWSLFGFLGIAWAATLLAARIRQWTIVPSVANIGLCLWALVYIAAAPVFETLPVTLVMLVMIAGVGFIWPGRLAGDADGADPVDDQPLARPITSWERVMAPPFAAVTVTSGISALLTALAMISPLATASGYPVTEFCVVAAALAALGALRSHAVYPALLAGLASIVGLWSITALSGLLTFIDPSLPGDIVTLAVSGRTAMLASMALSVVFIALGALANHLHLTKEPALAAIWAAIMAIVPIKLIGMSLLMTGNLTFDLPHGLFALATGVVLIGLAEWSSRSNASAENFDFPQAFWVAGSFGLFVIALHALTDGLATTILIAVLGVAYVAATRMRAWPALPWMMVGATIVVLARIAWEPTIVGPLNLGKTPVFNALLAGYGIPALLLILSAFELRNWPDLRVRNLLQALASLFALLTVAILVRHAMNGGVLDSSVPTLGEQSIYTLLAIGASGILMTLDMKSPSPVFRYGSMAVGVLSMISILGAHLLGLNPYFSGEPLGSVPFFDLLLIGYLLPGLGYAGLAWYARGKRPMPYVMALAVAGAILAFAWATLSVRRFWQGQNIADWKNFLQGETYTYSVVWLLLGVLLLVLGSRFNAKSIRIASAVLVFVAVLKVFLIDMANLEGFLRALSFIGLGGVLIGIGLFYQKILSGTADVPPEPQVDIEAEPGQTA
ncbi:DUF2339 domain-containing protein [Pararhizobium sp. BT-229]|uniref:DUF2339 domain-containing protein n=1 Tax=Pararhizobium sp. BT-229 TaxID=2986923 RepID=UPI0021F6E575|nr:DUF2339 domain-containing protein [Pararhizobium sp. BT-229]MCV9965904.1 DUF2339 domain-containing protein [Pararhizobium sp. BT-229]